VKILAVGIALFHAVGRMDGWTDMTRLTAFTTALQTCLKEAYARQQRYIRPQLHWSENRHNTTVWTDSRQGSGYQPHYCLCQRQRWNRSDWNAISQQRPIVWRQKKVGLFRADSLARYLLQCAYDSSVVAMDKTYLIDLLEIWRLFGTKETKITIQRS